MKTWVYIMQAGGDGPIKIGVTDNLVKRLRGVQTGNHERVVLLAAAAGGRKDEIALQAALGLHRIHLEWFRWNLITKTATQRIRQGQSIAEVVEYLRTWHDLTKRTLDLRRIAGLKREYRRHRHDPSYGRNYRNECAAMIAELDREAKAHRPDAQICFTRMMAMRAGAKLRAVAS